MRSDIGYGLERLALEVPDRAVVEARRAPAAAPLADVPAAVAAALETPLGFPAPAPGFDPDGPCRRRRGRKLAALGDVAVAGARTPDGGAHHAGGDHAGLRASTTGQPWLEDLPDEYEEVRLEVHDPHDRKRLSYLATTRRGRRIYVNRTVVDADQIVVLSGRRYDPVLGYAAPRRPSSRR